MHTYICVCVCVLAYIYLCVCVHMHTYICVCVCVCVCVCARILICVCSVLGAVLVVTEKLGNLLEDNAGHILHLLLGVAATCAACLQHRDLLKPSAAVTLKSVRQMAINRLIKVS